MTQILIVDDNPEKIADIRRLVDDYFLQNDVHLSVAGDLASAFAQLERNSFDLLIIDLRLPIRRGEDADPKAGLHLLEQLNRDPLGKYRMPAHVLGLTEFDELLVTEEPTFRSAGWFLVRYARNEKEWQKQISNKILHIIASRTSFGSGHDVDLVILTALDDLELQAMRQLPGAWILDVRDGDPTTYHKGVFERDGKRVSVVACSAGEMGMAVLAGLAMKTIELFRPKYLALGGIAAGVKGAANYGDILVADSAFDFGSGKRIADGKDREKFLPAPYPMPLDASARAKFLLLKQDSMLLEAVRVSWGNPPTVPLNIQIGPFASSSAVVADSKIVDEIIAHNRKLIGLDMETYALFASTRIARKPQPICFSAKSVSDFADAEKSDEFRRYAAYTSSRIIFEFALRFA